MEFKLNLFLIISILQVNRMCSLMVQPIKVFVNSIEFINPLSKGINPVLERVLSTTKRCNIFKSKSFMVKTLRFCLNRFQIQGFGRKNISEIKLVN